MKKNKMWIIILIALSIVGTLVIYPILPDEIPLHWNAKGEVDRVGAKINLSITALLPAIIYLMMVFIPKLDPKRGSYKKHEKAYSITIFSTVLFLIAIHWISIIIAMGYDINIIFVIKIGIGILLIVLGNYMTQIRQSYFFGIKTPWTLANETVWKKTHRVGGFGFVLSGLLFLATSFIKGSVGMILPLSVLMIMIVFTVVYSYLVFKKISR